MVQLGRGHAQTAWFALKSYRERLDHDATTEYDGDPRYGQEDEIFLAETIAQVDRAIQALERQGITY